MSSLSMLLQAAEYIERREREAEHGYAQPNMVEVVSPPELVVRKKSTSPSAVQAIIKSKRIISAPTIRSSHNELEKNRRAHLRTCLENLKDVVPLGPESNRHTTLGLLTRAKQYIMKLEDTDRKYRLMKDSLMVEKKQLEQRLDRIQQLLIMENFSIPSNLPACPRLSIKQEADEEDDDDDDQELTDDGQEIDKEQDEEDEKFVVIKAEQQTGEDLHEVQTIQTSLISGQHYVHRKVHKQASGASSPVAVGPAGLARNLKYDVPGDGKDQQAAGAPNTGRPAPAAVLASSPESTSLDSTDDSDTASGGFPQFTVFHSSDSDDQSSIGSYGSDGGLTVVSRNRSPLQLQHQKQFQNHKPQQPMPSYSVQVNS